MSDLPAWVAIEAERRRRQRLKSEGPRWDWYGEDCGCPHDGRKIDGSCPDHPRARDKQRPPDWSWHVWMILSGRGWGKTKTGAQWVIDCARKLPNSGRFALVGQTAADVRDVMIEGDSGILRCSPPWFRPKYEPSKRRLTWPNGFQAFAYSSEEPGYFRGPQFHGGWLDEFAKWSYLEDCWDNLQFGTRLTTDDGWEPKFCITTTPLPLPLIRELMGDAGTALVLGSTFENEANLARSTIAKLKSKYEGTRLGEQELHGKILEDNPGALWKQGIIDIHRVDPDSVPDMVRIVVAIDPSVSNPAAIRAAKKSDENLAQTGIVVVGVGTDGHFYVFEDCTIKASPKEWGQVAVDAYDRHLADLLVGEVNNGGALIEALLRTIDENVNYKEVRASRGKEIRAEPIASLYEQGRVHHVGQFSLLENEMVSWVPNSGMKSPDRVDALVWGLTEIALEGYPITVETDPFGDWRG